MIFSPSLGITKNRCLIFVFLLPLNNISKLILFISFTRSLICVVFIPIKIIPFVCSSLRKISRHSMKSVPKKGSPPIPTTKLCPKPSRVVCSTASYVRVPDLETMPTHPVKSQKYNVRYYKQPFLKDC